MVQYIAVLGYTEVFSKPIPEIRLTFLAKYPTELILLRLSRINAVLFQETGEHSSDKEIIKEIIFDNIPGFDKIEELSTNFKPESRWFSPSSISWLITDCLQSFNAGSPDTVINTLGFARDLLRTILIYNQIYYSRMPAQGLENLEAVFKLDVLQQGYLRDSGPLKLITLMKFAFISKFLDDHEPLKIEAIAYFKKIELGNPWLFGKFFLEVLMLANSSHNKGRHIIETQSMPLKLMREFAMSKANFADQENVSLNMDVVPKPFYFLTEQKAIILDFTFFQYAIDQGFFYSFYQSGNISAMAKFKSYNNFKSYIGLEFFEKFLVSKYLSAIFYRKTQKIVSTEKYQDFIIKSGPNDVIIFEIKMTDLHPKTLEELDYDRYKTFLEQNFLSEKSTGGKAKGAAQIIRQMDHLAEENSGLLNLLALKPAKRLNIYPVIICSDFNINISGTHEYLNDGFDKKLGNRRENFQSVKPIIIIHIDFFIEYLGDLRSNPLLFTALINGYLKNLKGFEQKYSQYGGALNYFFSKRSFKNYLAAKNIKDPMVSTLSVMDELFHLNIVDYGT